MSFGHRSSGCPRLARESPRVIRPPWIGSTQAPWTRRATSGKDWAVATTAEPPALRIVREPSVYLVGRQVVDAEELARFLADHEVAWKTDTEVGAERLIEVAGRTCYMSFGAGRKTNGEYIGHLVGVGHGSVLEHAVWNFIITGVSRSFTHELIRHRAGFGYSQLSQRYVDESTADFIEPDVIADDPELHAVWIAAVQASHDAYKKLVDGLGRKFAHVTDRTLRRKLARQAARSVLPNATETKIFITANARALRHFIEMRANEHAEVEIRRVAARMLRILQAEAPNVFGDYRFVPLDDGTEAADTPHRKV
jgi:thymidylate synthase (FAD)